VPNLILISFFWINVNAVLFLEPFHYDRGGIRPDVVGCIIHFENTDKVIRIVDTLCDDIAQAIKRES